MTRMTMRGAALAAACALALLGGCADNSGPQDVSGSWKGPLTLRVAGDLELGGELALQLDQNKSFASGGALWAPIGEPQGIAGPVDGIEVTLRLIFRCAESFETTVLVGEVSGDSIEYLGVSGTACRLGGQPRAVEGGSFSLTRTSDGAPL